MLNMINQQMTDMEFDTYFNVTSNTTMQQPKNPTPQKNQFNQQEIQSFNNYYIAKQTNKQTEMMNWTFNQQDNYQNNNHPSSFQQQTSPRPDYFYSTGQPNSAGTSPNNEFQQSEDPYLYQNNYRMTGNKGTGFITPDSDSTTATTTHSSNSSSSENNDTNKKQVWEERVGSIYDDSSSMMEAATVLASVGAGRQFKKVAHNAIERRYRKNINERILDLKNVVPALYKAKLDKSNDESSEDEKTNNNEEIVEGVPIAKKLNKATILHKATEYIHHLKHSNQVAENENQALLHILGQMPGGQKVLEQFQSQKREAEKAEQLRLIAQRKESMEQERIEHQRMLRERAAHRAALAELIPKPERKPYPRRAKKKQSKSDQKNDASFSQNNANKTFMVMFVCLAMASPLTFVNPPTHHIRPHSRDLISSDVSFPWYWVKVSVVSAFFILSLLYYVLRPYKRNKL